MILRAFVCFVHFVMFRSCSIVEDSGDQPSLLWLDMEEAAMVVKWRKSWRILQLVPCAIMCPIWFAGIAMMIFPGRCFTCLCWSHRLTNINMIKGHAALLVEEPGLKLRNEGTPGRHRCQCMEPRGGESWVNRVPRSSAENLKLMVSWMVSNGK